MIRIAIVEDEDTSAQALMTCLERYQSGHGIECSVIRFHDGESFLNDNLLRYDIIFMDIRMPGMDGMETAEKLRQKNRVATLIFVTNMVKYAVKGYELNALDFIVKPIRYAAFERKMQRALQAVLLRQGREIMIRTGKNTHMLASASIYYVEVMDHNITWHTDQGEFTARGTLGMILSELPETIFFRCSASHLINLQHVTRISGDSVWVCDTELRVSRGKRKDLMAAMAEFMGKGV